MTEKRFRTMLPINDYAEVSGLGINCVRRLCHTDSFPALQSGRRWLIHQEAADDWLAKMARNGYNISG